MATYPRAWGPQPSKQAKKIIAKIPSVQPKKPKAKPKPRPKAAASPAPKRPNYMQQALNLLKPQIKQIRQQGNRDIANITQYNAALAQLLSGIAPSIGAAYDDASGDIAGFGQGFSSDLRTRLQSAAEQANKEVGAITGNYLKGGTDPGAGYNADAAANAAYGLGAYFPAKGLREQGAAFQAAASFLPQAAAQQGLYAITARQRETQDALAGLRTDASGYALDLKKADLDHQEAIAKLAQDAYEYDSNLDFKKSQEAFDQWAKEQDLQFKSIKSQQDAQDAIVQGRRIDSSASRAAGYLIDKSGRPILNKAGKRIPIASSSSSSSSSSAAAKKAYQKAVEEARSMYEDSTIKTESRLYDGQYKAKSGARGKDVYADGSTDNPVKAQRTMTWKQAMAVVMEQFGLSRAQARKALVAAGWIAPRAPKPKYVNKGIDKTTVRGGN